ncbi:MAG: hypothetical protein IH586_18690 [Anaerolineaceae bacterium]|nr:hypothetical protein [Anaerolineaceae bacterium]
MNPKQNQPHLTPASLVGRRFARDTFKGIRVALAGYCPRPEVIDKYHPQNQAEQYFIHVPPANVQVCAHNGAAFLSISRIYGGPVSSALIEELAYYRIEYVLAYGLAGGLGTKRLRMGDYYLVEKALAMDGTTPHYTGAKLIASDELLNARILQLAPKANLPIMTPVQALTGDAIYREYDQDLIAARGEGCDIVNCDSSHLFAVSQAVGIHSTECGVLSDVAQSQGEEWQSTLSVMLSANAAAPGPMQSVGKIVEFYVEVLIPELMLAENWRK